jgi:hypothetical protein
VQKPLNHPREGIGVYTSQIRDSNLPSPLYSGERGEGSKIVLFSRLSVGSKTCVDTNAARGVAFDSVFSATRLAPVV